MARLKNRLHRGTSVSSRGGQQQQQGGGSNISDNARSNLPTYSSSQETPTLHGRQSTHSSSTMPNVNVTMPINNAGHDNNNDPLPRRSARIRERSAETNKEDEEEVDQLQQEHYQQGAPGELMDVESVKTSTATATPGPDSPGSITASRRGGTRHGVQTENEDSRFVLRWVQDNYQYEQDHNVPRSGMYEHYRTTCERYNMNPVNSATFGKLIRHVFANITTRRLGTRGQSRYHYCGIRRRTGPLPSNLASQQMSSSSSSAIMGQPQQQQKQTFAEPSSMSSTAIGGSSTRPSSSSSSSSQQQPTGVNVPFYQPLMVKRGRATSATPYYHRSRVSAPSRALPGDSSTMEGIINTSTSSAAAEVQVSSRTRPFSMSSSTGTTLPPYRGTNEFINISSTGEQTAPSSSAYPNIYSSSSAMPLSSSSSVIGEKSSISTSAPPPLKRHRVSNEQQRTQQQDVRLPSFALSTFADQSDVMMEFANVYEQHCMEILSMIRMGQLRSIYGSLVGFYQMLPDRFRTLIDDHPETVEAIWRWDCALYDSIIVSMLPTVQSPLSYEMNRGLREYTRELESYLAQSLDGYPDSLRERKQTVAQMFISKFRRHLKLNQMAQAAAALLRRPNTLEPMLNDWKRVDIPSILDQALWVCDCSGTKVENIMIDDVGHLLQAESNLDSWITWMKNVVDLYMTDHQQLANGNLGYFLFHAKQCVLKWSTYTSLILKDMTLSGAKSIDQFRILVLFFDDMMQFLVESRVAKAIPLLPLQRQDPSITHHHNRGSSYQDQTLVNSSANRGGQNTSYNASSSTMLETPPPSTSASSRHDIHSQQQQQQQETQSS